MSELLPYDLPGPSPDDLVVLVGGGDGEPERLLHISPPVEGLVRVREWNGDSWNSPPVERELPAQELLRTLEAAARQRRRLSEPLRRIRQWLTDGV